MKRAYEKVDEYLALALCALAAGVIFTAAGFFQVRRAHAYRRASARLESVHEQVRNDVGRIIAESAAEGAVANETQFNTLFGRACTASGIDRGRVSETDSTPEELPDKPYDLIIYAVHLEGITMPQLADLLYNLERTLAGARVRGISVRDNSEEPDLRPVTLRISLAVTS